MKDHQEETPPSSVDGDEIMRGPDDVVYLEELQFDDDEMLEDQEEEFADWERPQDFSVVAFTEHTGSVFCCDLHLNGKIAATGGEDDKAYVWSVESGQTIMECNGHKDSVIFAGFSFDGAYLATVDMSGLIKVWKCQSEESQQDPWPVVFEYEADELNWALWHFGARVLICGASAGDIYVFKIPSGETKVLQGHNIKTECGKVFPDGVRLAAGYEDGVVKFWDLKTNLVLHQVAAGLHGSRVNAIDVHPDNNLVASISTNGTVVLTTSNNGKVVGKLEAENDLETVAFCPDPELGFFALGTLNGSVTIWDIARQMMRHQCIKSEDAFTGVTKMIWIKDKLLTGLLDGSVRVYDGRSGEQCSLITGHWSEVLDMTYNAKENKLLTASDDHTARIFIYPTISEDD
ncbi:unnamed protein product [Leptidea sinapis]|uniref:Uncharacterized protein n=1 Tax=Leptidea sinapis TaxID=189913 RepID=A0A5E4QVT5_9NEOP|nr:unnamed protein product [Leptidea sinapis]